MSSAMLYFSGGGVVDIMLHNPILPMLLHTSDTVPKGSEYIHQVKWDGIRAIFSYIQGEGVKLFSRHQTNMTSQFPELQSELSVQNVVLDGEMVVMQDARPDFESVMTRFQASNEYKIQSLMRTLPAHFVAFDLLYLNGDDMTSMPLTERLSMLSKFVTPSEYISICPTTDDGPGLFQATKDLGLEGIVSKLKNSRWIADTRSASWLKVKHWKTSVVEIAGLRKDEFGWLIKENGVYKGVCELVPPKERKAFYSISRQIIRGEDAKWIYLDPVFKCKVKYHATTKANIFRTPSFLEFVFTDVV